MRVPRIKLTRVSAVKTAWGPVTDVYIVQVEAITTRPVADPGALELQLRARRIIWTTREL